MFGRKRIKKLEEDVDSLRQELEELKKEKKSGCTCGEETKKILKAHSKRIESNNQRIIKNKKTIVEIGERLP